MTCKVLETNHFCPVSVSIKLLRSYFNQQFYIMLYVYVITLRAS